VLADIANVARPAIESALLLPYDSWSSQEKMNYWVVALENNAHEDSVFCLSVIGKIKKIEQDIDEAMSSILKDLAMIKSADSAYLIAAFNEKTGLTVLKWTASLR
jgi:hypothetical protein